MDRPYQPKAMSLLYSIREHFEGQADWDGPEPEFWKWFDKVSCADIGECEDNVLWEKIDDKEKRVWQLFKDALYATSKLLEFRREQPELFLKAARRLSFLPTFLSWHPNNSRFNQQLLVESELGTHSIHADLRRHPHHLRHQSWCTRYAYAIVFVIDLNLDTFSEKLEWMPEVYGYGRRQINRRNTTLQPKFLQPGTKNIPGFAGWGVSCWHPNLITVRTRPKFVLVRTSILV